MGGEDLVVRGLEQIEDLSARVPNVSLIGGGATGDVGGSFVMRGVPGVGTYIDGVWQADTVGLLRSEFVELERVRSCAGLRAPCRGSATDGWSLFGEVDVSLTDQWTLTVGFRHQQEHFESFTKTPEDSVSQPGGYYFGNDAHIWPEFRGSCAGGSCTLNPAFDIGNFEVGQRYPADLMFRGTIGEVMTATLGPGSVPTLHGLQSAVRPCRV